MSILDDGTPKAPKSTFIEGYSALESGIEFQTLIKGKFNGVEFMILYKWDQNRTLMPLTFQLGFEPPPMAVPWYQAQKINLRLAARAEQEGQVLIEMSKLMVMSYEASKVYLMSKLKMDKEAWEGLGFFAPDISAPPDEATMEQMKELLKSKGTSTYGHK